MDKGNFKHGNTEPPAEKGVMALLSLKGRTAIVSGAGRGIGYAVAEGLAEAGADVAIWFNGNQKAIDRAADLRKKYGVKCKATPHPSHVPGFPPFVSSLKSLTARNRQGVSC